MDEEKYYNPDNVEDFACELGVEIPDTFKYLVSCVVDGTNPEDAAKLTPELLAEFEHIKDNCEEFIKTFNYYSIQLELFQKAEAEGRAEEVRENYIDFNKEVLTEVIRRSK